MVLRPLCCKKEQVESKAGNQKEEERFLHSSRNYWKFPLFSGKAVAGVEPRGEVEG